MSTPRTKCSVFIATSLDGFIAREDGGIDWLEAANRLIPEGEDCGYGRFMSTVDALVMGRNTFEQVLTFDDWPYGATPVTVLSRSRTSLPGHLPPDVSLSQEAPQSLVTRLYREGLRHLYIDGGITIQRFLTEGLIDEFIITLIPVLLGRGKSLFGPLPADIPLELIASRHYPFGFVQNHYRVRRN